MGGAKAYDGEKRLALYNYLILSAFHLAPTPVRKSLHNRCYGIHWAARVYCFAFYFLILLCARERMGGGAEPVFLNVYGAPESIPRNEFRQPM